jgi:hypothetical protein
MHVLHVNSKQDAKNINKYIENGSDVFILVYMVGCGPCNATRPEWAKLEGALKDQYRNNNKLVIVDVNKDFLQYIKHLGQIDGFPSMKYIRDHGKTVENYDNGRSLDKLISWIESKINTVISTELTTSSPQNVYNRIMKTEKHHTNHNYRKTRHNKNRHKKVHRGGKGKWTRKYKASINCSKPKGFSQKQYCKYGRK